MATLEVRGASLLTMADGQGLVEDGIVAAADGVITYAGPAAEYVRVGEPDEVLEAVGCVAIPGLVNAHTHCAMTLMRGFADDMELMPWLEEMVWPTEANITHDDVYWGAMLGSVEMLRAGVTCFNDMYHYFKAGTQAAIDSGIRACPSGVLLGFIPEASQWLADALEFVAELKAAGHPRIHPMFGPHAAYTCPAELLQTVTAAALEHNVPIHIHVSETQSEVADSQEAHGRSPVEHLDDIGVFEARVSAAHCVWLSDRDIEILAEKRVGVAHCPGSNLKLASGIAPVPKLLQAGAIVGLGTDGTASNNNLDLLEEARLAALIHKANMLDPTVVTAEEALTLATRGAAESLGLGDVIGTLEPGKRADLAIFDLSAPHLSPGHNTVSDLVYSARASDVRHTVVEGVVVMKDRELVHLDERGIIGEATRRGKELVAARG